MSAIHWHSKSSKVYHNNRRCEYGSKIKKKHKEFGTGGRKLCSRCKQLNKKKHTQKALK